MKTINPVYRQESRVSARSFKLPLIVLIFNCVLAGVALLDMYSMITQVRLTAELQYSSFLGLYVFAATAEFVLLLFFIPGLTAGSISGERERQTLDLMMTTRLTAADIVFGKLASALSTIFLLIVSSFPILGLVFIYGGVTAADVGLLLLCYVVTALLVGSIGVFCSAVSRRTTMATVSAYGLVTVLVIGTIAVNYIADGFAEMMAAAGNPAADRAIYLLLCNPAAMFQSVIVRQMGEGFGLSVLFSRIARTGENGLADTYWWVRCAAVQLALSALFLWGAVRSLGTRGRRSRRKR